MAAGSGVCGVDPPPGFYRAHAFAAGEFQRSSNRLDSCPTTGAGEHTGAPAASGSKAPSGSRQAYGGREQELSPHFDQHSRSQAGRAGKREGAEGLSGGGGGEG